MVTVKRKNRWSRWSIAAALAAAVPLSAGAALTEMSDEALSEIYGQALIDLTTTVAGGFEFTRIGFGAEGTINANLRNIDLGQYGAGTDIDIGAFQLGRRDLTTTEQLVRISKPYIEVAYDNVANAAAREIVGLRVGFTGIQGDVGVVLNVVSGSVLATGAPGVGVDFTGRRQVPVALSEIDVLRAGNADGMSRDFWLSIQKINVLWPALVPGTDPTAPLNNTALAGFWLNWRDRLQALDNGVGHAPPNNNVNY